MLWLMTNKAAVTNMTDLTSMQVCNPCHTAVGIHVAGALAAVLHVQFQWFVATSRSCQDQATHHTSHGTFQSGPVLTLFRGVSGC